MASFNDLSSSRSSDRNSITDERWGLHFSNSAYSRFTMKSICATGYAVRSILMRGVARTISPNELNRISRILLRLRMVVAETYHFLEGVARNRTQFVFPT